MTDLPSIFSFYPLDQFRQYHASDRAVQLFGHDHIIECIEVARGHETGVIRDFNADAFPIKGVGEQLLIVRATNESLTLALVADEVPILKAWFQSGPPYAWLCAG